MYLRFIIISLCCAVQCVKTGIEQGPVAGYLAESQVKVSVLTRLFTLGGTPKKFVVRCERLGLYSDTRAHTQPTTRKHNADIKQDMLCCKRNNQHCFIR